MDSFSSNWVWFGERSVVYIATSAFLASVNDPLIRSCTCSLLHFILLLLYGWSQLCHHIAKVMTHCLLHLLLHHQRTRWNILKCTCRPEWTYCFIIPQMISSELTLMFYLPRNEVTGPMFFDSFPLDCVRTMRLSGLPLT